MDVTLRATSAVMKFWHSIKDDDNLRRLALGSPEAVLSRLDVDLPEGIEVGYAEQGSEHLQDRWRLLPE